MSIMHKLKRSISYPGKVLVEVGQHVFPDTLIAETVLQPVEPVHLPVTEMFDIAPNFITSVLRVKVGDRVELGQILAVGSYGGQESELRSPGAGRIEQISSLLGTISLRLEGDPDEPERVVDIAELMQMPSLIARRYIIVNIGDKVGLGQLLAQDPDPESETVAYAPLSGTITNIEGSLITIKRPFILTQCYAFLEGTVVEIFPQFGAIIESEMHLEQGSFGLGGECYGKLKLLVQQPDMIASPNDISDDCRGKIVVAGALVTAEVLLRAREVGVAGIISGGAHNIDLVKIMGREIEPGLPSDILGFTLLLSEGMGQIAIRDQLFTILAQANNSIISMHGLTQIRAGVIRPSIYFDRRLAPKNESNSSHKPLDIGSQIRLIREPFFGELGKIVSLGGPDRLPSGIRTLTYEVKLTNGEAVKVARSNVEAY